MTQWDFSLDNAVPDTPTPSRRTPRVIPLRKKKMFSRPLVEQNYNTHLIHAGRGKKSIVKNGKKIKIRKVKKD